MRRVNHSLLSLSLSRVVAQDSAPDVYETPDLPPDSTYTVESLPSYARLESTLSSPLISWQIDSDSDSDSQYNSRTAASPTTLRRLATQQQQQQGPGNDNIDGDRLNTIEARKRFGQSGFPAKIESELVTPDTELRHVR